MGLIALGTAIGGRLALAAVLLHILGHGLAKAVAFCGAGQLLHRVGSPLISAVRGAIATAPATAALFGLAAVALLGLPPFALFASELALARAGFGGTPDEIAVMLDCARPLASTTYAHGVEDAEYHQSFVTR